MPAKRLNRAIKYRAYPTDEQAELFAKTFGCVRLVWNNMLADAQRFFAETGVFFITTPAKYKKEFPFLKEVDSLALANCQLDLKGAYHKALSESGVGFPNFKSKKKAKYSYTTNNQLTTKKDGSKSQTLYVGRNFVHLPKVGDVRICKHRSPKNGWHVKSATIERTKSGKYFITVLFEFEEVIVPVEVKTSIGLDYSSHDFYVDSNGDAANYPRFYRRAEAKLTREQRKLSHMRCGSKNYEKQKYKVQLLHEKVANQRRNFCQELSTAISKRYDAVFVEDINLRGLAGSLKLGKSTNDNGFGMFRNMLEYKLRDSGKVFTKIDKWFPSSKMCHVCGTLNEKLTLSDREWTCSCCGTHHNRDHNAAINIRNVGLQMMQQAVSA